MFTHTGAGAREITIEFNLTIPHIMRSVNSVQNAERLIKSLSTQKEKERFNNINPFVLENSPSVAEDNVRLWQQLRYESEVGVIAEHDAIRFEKLKQARADAATVVDESVSHLFQVPAAAPLHEGFDALQGGAPLANLSKTALTALNAAVFILETIRTCVAGNSTNTLLGPPLLRLRHGASYNDVPLICRDYDISVEEKAGYDMATLIPHRIKISLETSELRAGDFGVFEPGAAVARDNLVGWEAVIGTTKGTTDPGPLTKTK